jgi:hypothetical protein
MTTPYSNAGDAGDPTTTQGNYFPGNPGAAHADAGKPDLTVQGFRADDQPWNKQIPGLLCPSDSATRQYQGNSYLNNTNKRLGRSNYLCSAGDFPSVSIYHCRQSGNLTQTRENLENYFGSNKGIPGSVNTRGAFQGYEWSPGEPAAGPNAIKREERFGHKSFGGIPDGSSNTIALGEKCRGDLDDQGGAVLNGLPVKRALITARGLGGSPVRVGGIGNGTIIAGPSAPATVNPSACWGSNVSDDGKNLKVNAYAEDGGVRWNCGIPVYSTFSTVLPPNSGSCSSNGLITDWIMNSASSEHTGGVNAALFDGAVRFVPDTVDTGRATTGGGFVYEGPSNFGVWGALGSINGDETVSL